MKQKATSGHEDWLLNLAHQKLTDDEILKGFIKYYVLSGYVIDDLADDMLFKMNCSPTEVKERLIEVLEKAADESV